MRIVLTAAVVLIPAVVLFSSLVSATEPASHDAARRFPRQGFEHVKVQPESDGGKEHYVRVEVKGRLKTGILAIGGETTGTTITADKITWELDFGADRKLMRLAGRLDGKIVIVEGTLERKAGVEIPVRWIVHVSSLAAAER